ncbi:MAG: ribokinase [Opitutus sp.]|nr:ribokinase [Opitutus sp.]
MSSLSPQVVVVGSVMQDMTFKCTEFPARGETVVGRLAVGQGGKGSNQAIACGRAGARTVFVGAMGPGDFVQQVQSVYSKAGIGCRLAVKRGASTGTAVILINHEGQNEIVIEPGANARLAPADVPRKLLEQSRVALVQLEANLTTTAHVLRTARRAGVTTMLNPAPMRVDFDAGLLQHVDILVPNETEFAALVRGRPGFRLPQFSEPELHAMPANQLHALCRRFEVPTVIITLGRRGCFISLADGHHRLPAYGGMKVVDTTGAGDAFCGGFAAGLVEHRGDILSAARLGTAVAALSITKPGAAASMPTRAAVQRFLRSGKV